VNYTTAELRALMADRSPADRAAVEKQLGTPDPRPAKAAPRGMNKLEANYSRYLDAQKQVGRIIWWGFEKIRLRLAEGAWFKADFFVVKADGAMEVHEVKGFWREAARLRIKVAADNFPFKFIAVTHEKGRWCYESFPR
jgi:hypothetical protein